MPANRKLRIKGIHSSKGYDSVSGGGLIGAIDTIRR